MARGVHIDLDKRSAPALPRRAGFAHALCALLGLCSLLYFVPWARTHAATGVRWLAPQVVRPLAPAMLADLEDGHWVPRASPDLTAIYGGAYAVAAALPADVCPAPCPPARADALKRTRAKDLASWRWQGAGEISRDLDGKRILATVLQSTGGLILVGDDTQKQLFDFLAAILPSGLHLEETPGNASALYLPKTSALPAGVPAARCTRPVLAWVRDDTLLTRAEITDIVAEVGEIHEPAAALAFTQHFADGAWAARVRALTAPLGDWPGARNSTVVVSTGARWMADFPLFAGYADHQIIHAFAHGLEHAMKALTSLPRTQYLFRPMATRHERCWAATAPATSSEPSTADVLNKMWEHALLDAQDKLAREGPRPRGYLPVARRTALRPDAHTLVDDDCVHFEGPAVVEEWAKWVWHDMEGAR